jgi:hypothetical protein
MARASDGAMRSFWERLFYYRDITPGRVTLVAIEISCFIVVVVAFTAATFANFMLPQFGTGSVIGCYFTDALIVYIECPYRPWLGQWLSLAWLSSWGIHWSVALVPYSLIFLVPEFVMIWLAACLVRRLARR